MITLRPHLARLLISDRESERRDETYEYLERKIQEGRWDDVSAIWVTPNILINGLSAGIMSWEWHPTLKPLIMYNGHHRLEKALEHGLPVRAYVRYTLGNPKMPEEERLQEEIWL